MTTDFRALCAELVEVFKDENTYTQRVEALDRARAALATPPPEPPTDEELNRLCYFEFSTSTGHGESVDVLGFVRAVLERWGHG